MVLLDPLLGQVVSLVAVKGHDVSLGLHDTSPRRKARQLYMKT